MFAARTPPRFLTLVVLAAFSPLTLNMFLPSLANIARDLQADYALVGLSIGGYLAVTAGVLLAVGPLSDRYGRRPVLLSAIGCFAGASVMCALAQDVWTFLGFRMLQGGMASGFVLSIAIVRDTTEERKAAGTIGYISMTMAAAPMLAPMLGGALDGLFGWRSIFWLYAAGGAALWTLVWVDLGETRRRAAAGGGRTSGLSLWGEPRFWAFALCAAFSTGGFFIFLAGAPLVAERAFGVQAAELGVYIGSITAGFMAGGFLSGRLAPRVRPTTMMLAGRLTACAGLSAGLGALALGAASPWLFFGSTIFVGLGNGITMPSANSGAVSVRPSRAGQVSGMMAATALAGGAVMSTLTGRALSADPSPALLLQLLLGASAAGALAVLWLIWLDRRRAAAPAA